MLYANRLHREVQKPTLTRRAGGPACERSEQESELERQLPCIERGIPMSNTCACLLCCGRADGDTYADACDCVEEMAIRMGKSFCDCAVEFGDRILGQLAARQSAR